VDTKNNISIFAEEAVVSQTQQASSAEGYCYDDNTWKGLRNRSSGAKEGVAYSIDYNTALRQATFMSKVLGKILAARNDVSEVYQGNIGTDLSENENNLDEHLIHIASIANSNNFLLPGEVTTNKIKNAAVTTDKITDAAVTGTKIAANTITSSNLGSVLGTTSATKNGITVSLSQVSNKGSISIDISGDSVTNSDKIKINNGTGGVFYLVGSPNTSGYNDPHIDSRIWISQGGMHSEQFDSGGAVLAVTYMQAPYFNATSDARKKYDVYSVDSEAVKNIVENINVKHFKYKDTDKDCIGIIAQDVEKSNINGFELVELDKDGYLMVKESKLVYIMWDYIKQLKSRIEVLENK